MKTMFDLFQALGGLLALLGLAVFGVAVAWLYMNQWRRAELHWGFQAVVVFAMFAFAAVLARWGSAGGLGAFTLAAGITLLYLGTRKGGSQET
jgi:Kef-type K+ transport system membrane component KefB